MLQHPLVRYVEIEVQFITAFVSIFSNFDALLELFISGAEDMDAGSHRSPGPPACLLMLFSINSILRPDVPGLLPSSCFDAPKWYRDITLLMLGRVLSSFPPPAELPNYQI